MKNISLQIAVLLPKIQKQHVQILFVALTVLMLALGAGAPVDGGGISH